MKRSVRYLLPILIAAGMIGSMVSHPCAGEERKLKYGFSVFGGTGDAVHNKPNISAYGFLPRIDLALHRNWDLEFEGNYSYWNITRENDLYFLGADANVLFKPIQRNWGSLFLLAGGGLGYDNAGKRLKRDSLYLVGNQHFGGILQGGTGFYYNLGKELALRAEYRFYHISEPFKTDKGLNTHNFLLGISF
jgi:opacity protein-like surface antigen